MRETEKQRLDEIVDRLLSEEHFGLAVLAGTIAAVLAAAICGVSMARLELAYGFGVAAAGIVVGLSIQFLGRGVTKKFTVLAVVCTLAGCALGPLFAEVIRRMMSQSMSPIEVLSRYPLRTLVEGALSGTTLMYLVYLFVAVMLAVFLVERPLTRDEKLAIGHHQLKHWHD